ncbi:hypothetical protein [Nostoc sp. FACHB-110]|uniref:hypothetical protein n=1 Tax=Nostoc sp. FACHB-110 TaxID=2692834 RepID=UPI0016896E88|nr:hypothetical protein [Nostoc sp. FACHB-110]MBD2437846.1 hypothetical protein [Nostoc sp. FACHB-110]
MSQNSPIDSSIQSSKTIGLKPALAVALASLEVQLDQELARYRRARIASKNAYQPRMGSYVNNLPPETTEIPALTSLTLPVTEVKPSATPAPTPEPLPGTPAPVTAKTVSEVKPSQPPATDSSQTQIPFASSNSPGSIVPATPKAAQSENLIKPNETPTQPDDYLESSEALLRSLTDESQEQTKPPSTSNDSLLSPLGIGSMLLLLMASLTLGYVVFSPKSLPQFSLDKIFNKNSTANQPSNQTQGVATQTQSSVQVEPTPIPKYPNLAAKEFPEVKDPNDIVGLQPKLQSTPIVPVNPPVVIPTPTTPPVVNTLPQLQPVQPIQPLNLPPLATATPSAQPTTAPPQTLDQITPAADGFYHIVMDNEGDRALANARQVVPDAYFSPNKKLVYLGALKTKEQVQRRLAELQAKGIKARVQQP